MNSQCLEQKYSLHFPQSEVHRTQADPYLRSGQLQRLIFELLGRRFGKHRFYASNGGVRRPQLHAERSRGRRLFYVVHSPTHAQERRNEQDVDVERASGSCSSLHRKGWPHITATEAQLQILCVERSVCLGLMQVSNCLLAIDE
jgi:hypothetical protein